MRVSTKGIYALEVVTDLAVYAGETGRESLKNIAQRRELSEKYLERIIRELKRGGIVKSVRGAGGGYCLSRPAEQIKVQDVLGLAEGSLSPVACLNDKEVCNMDCSRCLTRGFWEQMWQEILSVTENVTVEDVVNDVKKHNV